MAKKNKRYKESWTNYTAKLSNGTIINIATNIKGTGVNNINDALINWLPRTNEYTSQSFADYINSKTRMTGHQAMTMEEYSKLDKIS